MAVGGVKARQGQKAQNEQAQQQQQGALNTYYKAYAACMEGRGYTSSERPVVAKDRFRSDLTAKDQK